MYEVAIVLLEALEAVYLAIEALYERFFNSDEKDDDDEQQSGVTER